jgi:hypothetical protein
VRLLLLMMGILLLLWILLLLLLRISAGPCGWRIAPWDWWMLLGLLVGGGGIATG